MSSGSETAHNREFVSQCWSKGKIEEMEDARIQAEIEKLEALKVGGDGGDGGDGAEGDQGKAAAAVDVQ